MTSPNLMAAAASQRTHRVKLLIYGNLLPIHNPLRLAEELSMLDCLRRYTVDELIRLTEAAIPGLLTTSRPPYSSSDDG